MFFRVLSIGVGKNVHDICERLIFRIRRALLHYPLLDSYSQPAFRPLMRPPHTGILPAKTSCLPSNPPAD
jgi:hypothetical protein